MPTLFPHQREGAAFLAGRTAALLADEQRVGKTASAITACDYVFARKILVITKSSARANWGREFRTWGFQRDIQVIYKGNEKIRPEPEVVVVGWGMVYAPALLTQLAQTRWDVLLLDESHEAKTPTTKRTVAAFNLAVLARRVWCLSGTPIPNAPCDLHPMLSSLARSQFPETYEAFRDRYCVTRRKYVGGQWITYAIKGKNEDELRERLKGFWLRRTQQDVGIRRPIFSLFTLHADKLSAEVRALNSDERLANIIDAALTGDRLEGDDEIHLGTLRRLTGRIKAEAVIEAAKEALEDGLDKLVLMAWHSDVIDALRDGLSAFGVVGIDGRTPPTKRDHEARSFQTDPSKRVFVGQIQAAGEAIDLSASAELWFVEASFVPMHMSQAAMRVTNLEQKRQALVRFCALEGSIDEALMAILQRKVASIKQIMEK